MSQILPVSTLGNVWATVSRICILMCECKEFTCQKKQTKNLSLQNYSIYYTATAGAGCETSISIILNYHFANKLLLIVCGLVLFLSWICE